MPHRWSVAWLVAAGVCGAAARAGAARRFVSPQIALPPNAEAPVVDGRIGEDGEWAGAVRMIGMIRVGQTALTHRRVVSWLLCDGERVYVAFKSELPPDGGLAATLQPAADGADVPTIKDDCVEVWFDPRPDDAAHGMVQALINPNGAVYDRRHAPDGEGGRARVVPDVERLGLASGFDAADFETGEPVPYEDGVLLLKLKKHDFRTLVLKPR